MSDFVHLHCHTEYSLLDGAIRLDDLCTTAKAFNMNAAAITDHGFLYGAVNFYLTCKKHGIKPIIGCEVYVANDHTDRTSPVSKVRHHLILLARDLTGYQNLIKLVSRSCLDGMYYKPRVDKALLAKHAEGLTALSACIAGEIPRTLLGNNKLIVGGGTFDDALAITKDYKHIFGEHFYLELQSNTLPEQALLNDKLCELAKATHIPLVATNDCHYLQASDVEAHDVLLCIQTQAKINDEKRMRFNANDLYYKSPEEMAQAFSHLPEALENTRRIADACNLELDLGKHIFPLYQLPDNQTPAEAFCELSRQGLRRRLQVHPDKDTLDIALYEARLELELKIICDMDFPSYFLIVQDFINWAKDNTIPVGPGRGSAAGSLVAWALRITNIDPIPYNLLFERFLNSERISLPDIDVDFCEKKRFEVIKYVSEKYGADCVAQITTFGKMKAKAVVRDVGRALDIPYADVDRIAKLIPGDLDITLRKALEKEPELGRRYDEDTQVHRLLDISMRLEGLVRHASTHAAGVVISDTSMDNYLPLYHGKKNKEIVTQYDMKVVEKVGLVKFDFLGLRTMTLIDETLKNIQFSGETPPDLDILPLTDSKTYELLSKGDTDGIFQLESSGMRQYLCKLKPTCFEDIIAMLALYRPGPLKSGMVDEFIKRKHGELKIRYPLPQLETCLKDTYGVIVYQEQVMQIAQIVGQYSLGNADLLRRAMGKKDPVEMAKERPSFIEGALKSKIPHAKATEIFDLMEKFAEYGFNKSHSAAYALITYYTAYLKTHYPLAFMAALLTSEIGHDQDKILKYIAACKDMQIPVQKPDIQRSYHAFTTHDGALIFGLGAIKNVGEEAIKEIVNARQADGPFASLLDLCTRVSLQKMNKRVLESLIKSGACDAFACTRASMLAALDIVVARAQKKAKDKQSNQVSLFTLGSVQETIQQSGIGFTTPEQDIIEWDEAQQMLFEKEALGFFLTSHPLQPYRQDCARLGLSSLEDVAHLSHKSPVRVAVLVTTKKEIISKKNTRMAFVGVEDLTASGEVTFFSDVLEIHKALLDKDIPLLLTATVDNRDQMPYDKMNEEENDDPIKREVKLLAISLQSLEQAVQESDAPICIDLSKHLMETSTCLALQELCLKHAGKTEVQILTHIDGIPCLFALGAQYRVHASPALRQDLAVFLQ